MESNLPGHVIMNASLGWPWWVVLSQASNLFSKRSEASPVLVLMLLG